MAMVDSSSSGEALRFWDDGAGEGLRENADVPGMEEGDLDGLLVRVRGVEVVDD